MGFETPICYVKVIVSKGIWRILKGEGLCVNAICHKYIYPLSIEEWFRTTDKLTRNLSLQCGGNLYMHLRLLGPGLCGKRGKVERYNLVKIL